MMSANTCSEFRIVSRLRIHTLQRENDRIAVEVLAADVAHLVHDCYDGVT